jgi:AcrR family transcriptional regulator
VPDSSAGVAAAGAVSLARPDGPIAGNGTWREPQDLHLSPILQHALDAFYEHGFHGTAVRDIARRVSVTVPALYYHHENKEAILDALLNASIDRVNLVSGQALAEAGPNPADRFLNLVESLVLYMAHSGKLAYLDNDIRALGPANRRAYTAKRRVVEQRMIDVIADGEHAGIFEVTSAAETARALLGTIQAVASWFRPDGPLTPEEVAVHYLDIAAHTVGADAATIAAARARPAGPPMSAAAARRKARQR